MVTPETLSCNLEKFCHLKAVLACTCADGMGVKLLMQLLHILNWEELSKVISGKKGSAFSHVTIRKSSP